MSTCTETCPPPLPELNREYQFRPSAHRQPSPSTDTEEVVVDVESDSDDKRTLASAQKRKWETGASQEGTNTPSGSIAAAQPKKKQICTRKRRAIIAVDDAEEEETPHA